MGSGLPTPPSAAVWLLEQRADPPPQNNAEVIGPFFLGIILNYFLWGIQITQTYYYYKSYRNTDRTALKTAVILLFVVDAIQGICVSQASWAFLVDGWGDQAKLLQFGWGLYMVSLTDSITASIVHFSYAHKVWMLLKFPHNYIWTGIVLFLSCTQLTAGIGCTIFMFIAQITLPQFFRIKTWVCVWLISASATDIIITLIITARLSKSRTGLKKTDDIISRLIRLIVETGLATAVVQIIHVIIYLRIPTKPFHVITAFVSPKVYSNSMMALLNSRQPRKDGLWESRHAERPIDSIQIHTSQSVAVSNDYELMDAMKQGGPRASSRKEPGFDADGDALPSLRGKEDPGAGMHSYLST